MIRGIHHVALHTPDIARLARFYIEVVGFVPVEESRISWSDNADIDQIINVPGSASQTMLLRAGNSYLELFQYSQPAARGGEPLRPQDHGYTHICLDTDDIEADYERLTAGGMTFHRKPVDLGEIQTVYGKDPDGNIIELQQLTPSHGFALARLAEAAS